MIYINITNSFVTRRWTGIQRVVREVSNGLRSLREDMRLIVFTKDGIQALEGDENFAAFMRAEAVATTTPVRLQEIQAGDILLDMDATWGDQIDYTPVIRRLKSLGMVYVKLHHDAVPLIYPQFCDQNTVYNFCNDFQIGVSLADHWICTTQVVQKDLQKLFDQMHYGKVPSTVVPLGSDIAIAADEQRAPRAHQQALTGKKIILSVGTIEPRKNYELVMDAFEQYCLRPDADHLTCLVLVGRSGWNNAAIKHRITHAEGFNQRIFWFDDASDAELNYFYSQAWICLCLSHYEGFGLPAVEALSHQVPVICIANSAMQEVTAGFGCAVEKNAQAVVQALLPYMNGPAPKRIQNYSAITWEQTAKGVNDLLENLQFHRANFEHSPTQAVYISIRPDKVRRSIDSIVARMHFIQECIVLTSDQMHTEMAHALDGCAIQVMLLRESEVGLTELPKDHVERNMLLRKVLYAREEIAANFIAFDDDYVVIQDVALDVFIENGKHKAYYFYEDGTKWAGASPKPTSYDRGVWRTVAYLAESGYATRLYSAHQPQIINKKLAAYIYSKTWNLGLDEWSSYFNMACHLCPNVFVAEKYVAAGWPGDFNSWIGELVPDALLFFNDPQSDGIDDGAISEAKEWRNELLHLRSLKTGEMKGSPILMIESDKCYFDMDSIAVDHNDYLKISFLSLVDFSKIEWTAHGIFEVYDFETAPSFLYINFNSDKFKGLDFVDVCARVGRHEKFLSAKIRIILN